MIIITDLLRDFIDEGTKIATLNLIQSYKRKYPCNVVIINSNCNFPFDYYAVSVNKALYNKAFYNKISSAQSNVIVYIPHSSITLATFCRAKLLKFYTRKQVNVLSLQPVKYNFFVKFILSIIHPPTVITQSATLAKQLDKINIKTKILPLGVDDNKFYECGLNKKNELRKKYFLERDKKIVLHIGHIKRSRNIEWLIEVKKWLPDMIVLVVSSTTTEQDNGLRSLLEKEGIIVVREYIPNIAELYQLADYYVFPVVKYNAAIETPLSVLEAMSSNLPILTTRFGSLPDTFCQDEYFKFVNDPSDIVGNLKKGFPPHCNNRKKIKNFTWEAVADRLHGLVYYLR